MIYTSRFSGRCDLFDHIAGLGGWYDKEGNPVKFGQAGVTCYYSDELQDFEAFKKQTNGVLHQHYKVKVDEYNQQFVKDHCKEFNFIEHTKEVEDKRSKTGKRIEKYYTYRYYNQEYNNLKELNKHEVYIETDIHFNTLLDLIPYYPYIIGMSCGSYVAISKESFVDQEFKEHLQHGWISELDYKKELQEHYLDVCKNYFLYKLDERTKQVPLIGYKPLHNGYYELLLDKPADYMHEPKFVWKDGKVRTHWTSPKISDTEPCVILISEQDIESFLVEDIKNNNIVIEYVETTDFPKEIN